MVNTGVLVSGSGTNLQAIIDAKEAGRLDASVKVVISDNPEAYALERASRHGISSEVVLRGDFSSKRDFEEAILGILRKNGVELVVLAGFMRLLSPEFIKAYPMRIMNIHPALLPSFPGLDVQKKAVDYGVRFSGCTVHFVDEGCDTGPIIIQAVVPVLPADTPETLARKIQAEEHRIYPQAIQFYSEGRLGVEGRSVVIKDAAPAEGAIENPTVELFGD